MEETRAKDSELEAIKNFMSRNGNEGEVRFIEPDDTFGFHCQQCGRCCMNRRDIILNPFDVFNGARYLGITCGEFLEKYTYTDLGGYSLIPMVLLETNEKGWCPLLKFDVKDGGKFKCSIHAAKPGACANHPIGIVTGRNVTDGTSTTKFVKVEQCPNSVSDEQQVVRDWCHNHFDHKEEIDLAHELQTLAQSYFNVRRFTKLCALIGAGQLRTDISDEDKEFGNSVKDSIGMLYNMYLGCNLAGTYEDWDITRPFAEQAKERIAFLKERYSAMKNLYDGMEKAFEDLIGKSFKDISDEEFDAILGSFIKEGKGDGDN